MKKRSEVMASKKSSAAERTVPLFDAKESRQKVTCEACDEESLVGDLIHSEGGKYECPYCGSRIKLEDKPKASPASPKLVENKSLPPQGDKPKVSKTNTSDTNVFCEECGTQWPRVNEEIWKICGHKGDAVDDPGLAKQIKHLAGQPIPVVKKVRVVYGEQMFRVAEYATFRSPLVELEAEVKPNEDYREIQARLYLEAKRQSDEAFHNIYESYMEKLGFIRDDLATRK